MARQYCAEIGKQDNCQVAVSVSLATGSASVPIAWRLCLPEAWASDAKRRAKADAAQVAQGIVLADELRWLHWHDIVEQ